MYPGRHAITRADQPAILMARSGDAISYREFEARANRLAHLLRSLGLKRLDHFAVFMENHPRYVECGAAGARASSPAPRCAGRAGKARTSSAPTAHG